MNGCLQPEIKSIDSSVYIIIIFYNIIKYNIHCTKLSLNGNNEQPYRLCCWVNLFTFSEFWHWIWLLNTLLFNFKSRQLPVSKRSQWMISQLRTNLSRRLRNTNGQYSLNLNLDGIFSLLNKWLSTLTLLKALKSSGMSITGIFTWVNSLMAWLMPHIRTDSNGSEARNIFAFWCLTLRCFFLSLVFPEWDNIFSLSD